MKAVLDFLVLWAFMIFVIICHELGHYFSAKRRGVVAEHFCVGWGPRLFGVRIGGTDFCVKLLPLGGSCDFGDNDSKLAKLPAKDKIATLFAGPGVNLALGFLSWVILRMLCGDSNFEILTGYFKSLWNMLVTIFTSFKALFSADGGSMMSFAESVGTEVANSDALTAVKYLLAVSVIINNSLGIGNLIPIPALDGGQIALTIPELFHHPLKQKTIDFLNTLCYVELLLFSVGVMVIDILRAASQYLM